MKDQRVGIPVAKLAKEKGFNWETDKSWVNDYFGEPMNKWGLRDKGPFAIVSVPAPTQSLLQRWLREVHDTHIMVESNISYHIWIQKPLTFAKWVKSNNNPTGTYETYEDALDEGLLEALRLIP